jgi:hypothetical protein
MTHRRVVASMTFAIGLAAVMLGCSPSNDSGGRRGSLTVSMAAAGAPAATANQAATEDDALSRLRAAVITVAGIEARMADGTWVPVETGFPTDIDLIARVSTGSAATLPADFLPEGDYDALQLRITDVQLTPKRDTAIGITPPGNGWTVQIPVSFSVAAGRSTVVGLKLRCGDSLRLLDDQFEFDPEIEVEGIKHD